MSEGKGRTKSRSFAELLNVLDLAAVSGYSAPWLGFALSVVILVELARFGCQLDFMCLFFLNLMDKNVLTGFHVLIH